MRRTIAGLTALLVSFAMFSAVDVEAGRKHRACCYPQPTCCAPVATCCTPQAANCSPSANVCNPCECKDATPVYFCVLSNHGSGGFPGEDGAFFPGKEYTSNAACGMFTNNGTQTTWFFTQAQVDGANPAVPENCPNGNMTTPSVCCLCVENCARDCPDNVVKGRVAAYPGLKAAPSHDYEFTETATWKKLGHTFVKINRGTVASPNYVPVKLVMVKSSHPDPSMPHIPIFYGVGHQINQFPSSTVAAEAPIAPVQGAGHVVRVQFGPVEYIVVLKRT